MHCDYTNIYIGADYHYKRQTSPDSNSCANKISILLNTDKNVSIILYSMLRQIIVCE